MNRKISIAKIQHVSSIRQLLNKLFTNEVTINYIVRDANLPPFLFELNKS